MSSYFLEHPSYLLETPSFFLEFPGFFLRFWALLLETSSGEEVVTPFTVVRCWMRPHQARSRPYTLTSFCRPRRSSNHSRAIRAACPRAGRRSKRPEGARRRRGLRLRAAARPPPGTQSTRSRRP